ncbi:hypothetical protein ACS0TY_028809 [Phlomoides rotata]
MLNGYLPCSFDRHALDLLEKMLVLDPAQILFFSSLNFTVSFTLIPSCLATFIVSFSNSCISTTVESFRVGGKNVIFLEYLVSRLDHMACFNHEHPSNKNRKWNVMRLRNPTNVEAAAVVTVEIGGAAVDGAAAWVAIVIVAGQRMKLNRNTI